MSVCDLCQAKPFCDLHMHVLRTQQVRAVCSSGGHFARQASGKEEYEGGETRLVSVADFCSLADLQEALERVAAARQGGGARPGAVRRFRGLIEGSRVLVLCRRFGESHMQRVLQAEGLSDVDLELMDVRAWPHKVGLQA